MSLDSSELALIIVSVGNAPMAGNAGGADLG